MKSSAYVLGVVCGLALVALVCLIVKRVRKGDCLFSGVYDERQRAVQGRVQVRLFHADDDADAGRRGGCDL